MTDVHELASADNRKSITLSSFILNKGAVRFYERLGYQIVESEDDFQSFKIGIT